MLRLTQNLSNWLLCKWIPRAYGRRKNSLPRGLWPPDSTQMHLHDTQERYNVPTEAVTGGHTLPCSVYRNYLAGLRDSKAP